MTNTPSIIELDARGLEPPQPLMKTLEAVATLPEGATLRVHTRWRPALLYAELGTVSETFSRTLAKFRDQKLLAVKGRVVTVLSPEKLRALLRRNLGE